MTTPTEQTLVFNKTYIQQMLMRPDVYATTLLVLALDKYGPEMLDWHPQTIRAEIEDDFGVKLPEQNVSKLMAAITILTTDLFERSLPSFVWLCNVLADDTFDPTIFDVATAEEMAWGITEALLIRPPESEEHFAEETRWYIGAVMDSEGVVDPPDVLRLALRKDATDPLDNFVDDPEMYQALYESQKAKSQDIEMVIRENLDALVKQLETLTLDQGDTSNLLKRIREQSSR